MNDNQVGNYRIVIYKMGKLLKIACRQNDMKNYFL